MMAMMNIEHQMELSTPRSMARTSFRVHAWRKAFRHAGDADLGALIAGGRGDVPLIQTRWRCGNCGSRLAGFCRCGISHFRPVRVDRGMIGSALRCLLNTPRLR